MLTRDKARTTACPHRVDYIEHEYHQDGSGVAHQIFHHHNCMANDCPKWVDAPRDEEPCAHFVCCPTTDCIDSGIDPNSCPHRFGRCGA